MRRYWQIRDKHEVFSGTRGRVYELIQRWPGINTPGLSARSGVKKNTIEPHLAILKNLGLIVSERFRHQYHYYSSEVNFTRREKVYLACLNVPQYLETVRAIQRNVSTPREFLGREVEHEFNRERCTALERLKRLGKCGILNIRKKDTGNQRAAPNVYSFTLEFLTFLETHDTSEYLLKEEGK